MCECRGSKLKGKAETIGDMEFGYENLEACPVEFPLCGTSY